MTQRSSSNTTPTTQQVTSQVEQKAGQLTEQAKHQATSQLDSQKQRASQGLDGVAQALRQTGQHLREQDRTAVAQYTDKAAEQIEHFSGTLRERSAGELIGDAERFARREPMLFVGGAFLLGLLGARFLKSSGQHQEGSGQQQSQGGSASYLGRRSYVQSSPYPSEREVTRVARTTVTETAPYTTTPLQETIRRREEP